MSIYPLLLTCLLTYQKEGLDNADSIYPGADENLLPLLLYFSSTSCDACAPLDVYFLEPEVITKMERHYVSALVNVDQAEGKACAEIYHVEKLPGLVIADRKGFILYKSDGSLTIEDITHLIEAVPHPSSAESEEVIVVATQDRTHTIPSAISSSEKQPSIKEEDIKIKVASPVAESQVLVVPSTDNAEIDVNTVPSVAQAESDVPAEGSTHGTYMARVEELKKTKHIEATSPASTSSSKPKPTSASTATSPKPARIQYVYSIQLGFFSEETNSKTLMQKATSKGIPDARIIEESRDGKPFFRVLAGRFNTLSAVQALLADVHSKGLKGAVYRQ